jgi:hypothetical protein
MVQDGPGMHLARDEHGGTLATGATAASRSSLASIGAASPITISSAIAATYGDRQPNTSTSILANDLTLSSI